MSYFKVSLLDLAGSERFAKSGASTDQLREASSINKSLSTLGDVISALASDQQHTPYRNSKLTMLMQDSLGGNAKTLLFVTASIAHYNLDETLTSLTYISLLISDFKRRYYVILITGTLQEPKRLQMLRSAMPIIRKLLDSKL